MAIDAACRINELGPPEWILECDRWPGVAVTAPLHERFVLYETFRNGNSTVSFRPDASCHIRVRKRDKDGTKRAGNAFHLIGYLEVDRSTESLSQIQGKLPGIHAFTRQPGAHRRHWPSVPNALVRVFFLCRSVERIANVARSIRKHPASELFRFATFADLEQPERVFTEPVWRDAEGNRLLFIKPAT
jgi:hypothetical protein